MNKIINQLKGDKTIWAVIVLLALVSFLPVYSASTNLVYTVGNGKGSTLILLLKHCTHVIIGLGIVFFIHKLHFEKFKKYSIFAIWIIIPALLFTLLQGKTIGGANASRWLEIPFVNFSFQPSTLAFAILMVYVARTLTKINETKYTFKDSVIQIWIPVGAVLIFILPSNFSTAALMFAMVFMLLYIGQYPLKYLGIVLASGVALLALFFLLAQAFPKHKTFSRVNTWVSRIENFTSDKPDEDKYQIENAKIAIAVGKINGVGPGKSIQKNFLPQSSSDFIFAIIIEEYGLIGGYVLVFFYMLLFFRFLIRANKTTNLFGKLLIIGLGFPIIIQALINMGVAVELLPVTGQPLPLISSGGTSIWMTCLSLGIILSVTKREDEIAADLKDFQDKEAALQRLIEREVVVMNAENDVENLSEDEHKINDMKYSIRESLKQDNETEQGDSLVNGQNPMNAVINKK
ncbi:FtsW/RodA/SpoVE family cell cycle protein [Flavobacterium sp.]|uniref:FtsW/RodA/SpoVE family cell cycle protein n=1 Tax=Flavobacterium sp. TaxID=239 RepID=UPI001B49B4F3|nr:FtsW/RodA/SpoVE family cell cycle protein [Flavobacterium sp.]MBP6126936.1 FtsW/RodA/SpoVE family cell cycle protein [Flavobacterium sp.]